MRRSEAHTQHRTAMKRGLFASPAAIAIGLMLGATSQAEEAATPDPVAAATAATNAQAGLINAQATKAAADKALIDAQVGALKLPELSGKTTLASDAGAMEAWILSGGAIEAAAEMIATDVDADAATFFAARGRADKTRSSGVVVLGATETLNLSLPASLQTEMEALTDTVERLMGSQEKGCPLPGGAAPTGAVRSLSAAGAFLPVLGAVVSALKGESEIRSLAVEPGDGLLVDAIAGQSGSWIIPSESVAVTGISETALGKSWSKLAEARATAVECRNRLSPAAEDDEVKARIAALDGVITPIDLFATRATQTMADKPNLLVQAAMAQTWIDRKVLVLRVSAKKAGGSLLKRDHIGTALGFTTGVKLSGGLVVSYRLTDPADGTVKGGGLITCRTALTSMKDVHAGTTAVSCR